MNDLPEEYYVKREILFNLISNGDSLIGIHDNSVGKVIIVDVELFKEHGCYRVYYNNKLNCNMLRELFIYDNQLCLSTSNLSKKDLCSLSDRERLEYYIEIIKEYNEIIKKYNEKYK